MASSMRQADSLDLRGAAETTSKSSMTASEQRGSTVARENGNALSHSIHHTGHQNDEYQRWSHHQHSEMRQHQTEQRLQSSSSQRHQHSEMRQSSSEQRRSTMSATEQRGDRRAFRNKVNSSSITFHSEYDPWKDATITRRGDWKIVTPCPAANLHSEKSNYKLARDAPEHKFYLPVVE